MISDNFSQGHTSIRIKRISSSQHSEKVFRNYFYNMIQASQTIFSQSSPCLDLDKINLTRVDWAIQICSRIATWRSYPYSWHERFAGIVAGIIDHKVTHDLTLRCYYKLQVVIFEIWKKRITKIVRKRSKGSVEILLLKSPLSLDVVACLGRKW